MSRSGRSVIGKGVRANHGFTLIELLISMTIMALVITVLYQAFAMATRVWSRQQLFDETSSRQLAATRLLHDDLTNLYNYTWQNDSGKHTFFATGPATMFYVTGNGFGAKQRQQYGLFFCCCYLSSNEDGSLRLMLYKTPWPETELCDAMVTFSNAATSKRADYQPPQFIRSHSVMILNDLSAAQFSFAQGKTLTGEQLETDALPLEQLSIQPVHQDENKTAYMLFNYNLSRPHRQYIELSFAPDAATDPKNLTGVVHVRTSFK